LKLKTKAWQKLWTWTHDKQEGLMVHW